jgi:hypothetical protein
VQAQHPGLNNIEYRKILAQMWNSMAEDQKIIFKHMVAELQNDFKHRNPNYGYRKTTKREAAPAKPGFKATEDPITPEYFSWEHTLNHHEEAAPSVCRLH